MSTFRCLTPLGQDLCYFGTCNATTQECDCGEGSGWSHDSAFFHWPNCTMPKNVYLIAMIVSFVATIFYSVILVRGLLIKGKGPLRRLYFVSLSIVALVLAASIAVYLEDGFYRVASATLFIQIWLVATIFSLSARMWFSPLFSLVPVVQQTRILRALDFSFIVIGLVATSVVGIMVAYSAFENYTMYNYGVIGLWFGIALVLFYQQFLVFVSSSGLIRVLKHASRPIGSDASNAIESIKLFTQTYFRLSVPISIFALTIPICALALGSIPFFWAPLLFLFVIVFPGVMSLFPITLGRRAGGGNPETSAALASPFGGRVLRPPSSDQTRLMSSGVGSGVG